MRLIKRSITLIEMLLVIALVGLTLGVIAIGIPKAFKKESFEQGIDQVKSKIALAQEVMLNYQTDVLLSFTLNDDGKLICLIQTGKPISETLLRNLNRYEQINGIEDIVFDDGSSVQSMLFFDGTLGATPKGKLILKTGNREAILTLKGFPSRILRGDHVTEESKATYPETIFSLS